jgi:hypothetical protein
MGIAYMLQHISRDVLSKKARLTMSRIAFLLFGTFIVGFFLWIALMVGLHASRIDATLAKKEIIVYRNFLLRNVNRTNFPFS